MSIAQTLGKYEIRGTLGRGAMGIVYDGFDPVIDRRVAIKTVPLPPSPDPETAEEIARFKREAQAAGRLAHPNIVAVFDYGETADLAYIVMEFVDGPTLKSVLDKNERFPIAEIVRIMDDLLAGLQFSHERGVVHRDIKPANIMLTRDGRAKITDFGIARIETSSMTQAGTVLGTPAYMSPEQFMGQVVDARTDVYSAGVVLYQMLTGERPFEGGLTAIMHKALNTEATAPSRLAVTAPPALDAVVARAMAKRPEGRYPSAAALAEAIRAALAAPAEAEADATIMRPAAAPPPAPKPTPAARAPAEDAPPPARPGGSRIPLLAGAAVVVLALLGGGWFVLRPASSPAPPVAEPVAVASPPAPARAADATPAQPQPSPTPAPPVLPPKPAEASAMPATPAPQTAEPARLTQTAEPARVAPPAEPAGPAPVATEPAKPAVVRPVAAPAAPAIPEAPPSPAALSSLGAALAPATSPPAVPAQPEPASSLPAPSRLAAAPALSSATVPDPARVALSVSPAVAPSAAPNASRSEPAQPPPAPAVPTTRPPPSPAQTTAAAEPSALPPAAAVHAQPSAPPAPAVAGAPPLLPEPVLPRIVPLPERGQEALLVPPAALRQEIAHALAQTDCTLADASLQDSGRIAVDGLVASSAAPTLLRSLTVLAGAQPLDWRMQSIDPKFCDVLAALRPVSPLAGAPSMGLAITLADDRLALRDGEPIRPRVTMADFAGELRVDYVAHDGSLVHLFPTLAEAGHKAQPARRFAAGEHLALGDAGPGRPTWEVGPPYGTDIVIAVASTVPLKLAAPHNAEDDGSAYLAALRAAIVQARQGGGKVTGSLVLVDTLPK